MATFSEPPLVYLSPIRTHRHEGRQRRHSGRRIQASLLTGTAAVAQTLLRQEINVRHRGVCLGEAVAPVCLVTL